MWKTGCLGLCLALGAGGACAEPHSPEAMRLLWRSAGHVRASGVMIADFAPVLVATLRKNDVDGVPGLSRADAELQLLMSQASTRAQQIEHLLVNDLDGDLQIHRAEAETVALIAASEPLRSTVGAVLPDPAQRQAIARRIADEVMAADSDADGVVSMAELYAFVVPATVVPAEAVAAKIATSEVMRVLVLADADGDGTASPAELAAWVHSVLSQIDTDGDGRLSVPEVRAMR